MIKIKSQREIELLREAGHIVYQTHQYLKPYIKEGITTAKLDRLAEKFIRSKGAIPSCKGYEGYHGDSAWTYPVGNISAEKENLLRYTKQALFEGLKEIKPGARIGDISNAIEVYATEHNLGVVKELVGHGVGTELHEEPDVPNYGKKGTGPVLKEGMVIAVEPMLNLGTADIYMLDDGWTILTDDDSPSAHFEHTVVVTKDGYEILTGE